MIYELPEIPLSCSVAQQIIRFYSMREKNKNGGILYYKIIKFWYTHNFDIFNIISIK